jgi:hypothetical protein
MNLLSTQLVAYNAPMMPPNHLSSNYLYEFLSIRVHTRHICTTCELACLHHILYQNIKLPINFLALKADVGSNNEM